MKTWFITGTSSGLGRALAEEVIRTGNQVVATARKLTDIEDLAALAPDRVLTLTLDVHKEEDAKTAIHAAVERFGGIDVLVNNAGYGLLGAFEDVTDEQIRQQFETNVFGLMYVTRAALPVLRKQQSGHILNITSVLGLTSFPGYSIYSASKFAVEGFSLGLAEELALIGIKMTIIEPGAFRTKWANTSLSTTSGDSSEYEDTAGGIRNWLTGLNGSQPGDPARAAEIMIRLVESENPPLQLVMGREGLENVKKRIEPHLKNIQKWAEVSISADFGEQYPVPFPKASQTHAHK